MRDMESVQDTSGRRSHAQRLTDSEKVCTLHLFYFVFFVLLYLQPNGVLVFPLHVVDVPGHSLHGVYGFLHNLVSLRVLLHVVGYLLHRRPAHNAGNQHLHILRCMYAHSRRTSLFIKIGTMIQAPMCVFLHINTRVHAP